MIYLMHPRCYFVDYLDAYLLMVHDELLDQVCVIFDGLELQTKSNDCIISQEIFRVILLQLLT